MPSLFHPCLFAWIWRSHFGEQEFRCEAVGGKFNVIATFHLGAAENFLAVQNRLMAERHMTELMGAREALNAQRALG